MDEELTSWKKHVEGRLDALEAAIGPGRNATPAKPGTTQSPREFLLSKSAKTDNDKTLLAAYYIEVVEGRESFDFDAIETFYGKAKEAAPVNRRDPPYQNVKKGYFREVGKRAVGMHARNRWALTNSGIERVEKVLTRKDG